MTKSTLSRSLRKAKEWSNAFRIWVPHADNYIENKLYLEYPDVNEAIAAYFEEQERENNISAVSHAPTSPEPTSSELQPSSNGTDAPRPPLLEASAPSPSDDVANCHHAAAEHQPPVPAEQPDRLSASAPVPSDARVVPLRPSALIIHRSAFSGKKRGHPDSDEDSDDGGDDGGDEGMDADAPLPNDEDYYDDDEDMTIADAQVEDGDSNDDDDEKEVDGVDEDDAGVLSDTEQNDDAISTYSRVLDVNYSSTVTMMGINEDDDEGMGTDETAAAAPAGRRVFEDSYDSDDSLSIKRLLSSSSRDKSSATDEEDCDESLSVHQTQPNDEEHDDVEQMDEDDEDDEDNSDDDDEKEVDGEDEDDVNVKSDTDKNDDVISVYSSSSESSDEVELVREDEEEEEEEDGEDYSESDDEEDDDEEGHLPAARKSKGKSKARRDTAKKRYDQAAKDNDANHGFVSLHITRRAVSDGNLISKVHRRANNKSGTDGDKCITFDMQTLLRNRRDPRNTIEVRNISVCTDSFTLCDKKTKQFYRSGKSKSSAESRFVNRLQTTCPLVERPNLGRGSGAKPITPNMVWKFQHELFYPGASEEELASVRMHSGKKVVAPSGCIVRNY